MFVRTACINYVWVRPVLAVGMLFSSYLVWLLLFRWYEILDQEKRGPWRNGRRPWNGLPTSAQTSEVCWHWDDVILSAVLHAVRRSGQRCCGNRQVDCGSAQRLWRILFHTGQCQPRPISRLSQNLDWLKIMRFLPPAFGSKHYNCFIIALFLPLVITITRNS